MIEKPQTLQREATTAGHQAASTQSIENPDRHFESTDKMYLGYHGLTPKGLTHDTTTRLMEYRPVPLNNGLTGIGGFNFVDQENPFRVSRPQSGINTGRPVLWQRVNMH
eukprot:CFRG8239T1